MSSTPEAFVRRVIFPVNRSGRTEFARPPRTSPPWVRTASRPADDVNERAESGPLNPRTAGFTHWGKASPLPADDQQQSGEPITSAARRLCKYAPVIAPG